MENTHIINRTVVVFISFVVLALFVTFGSASVSAQTTDDDEYIAELQAQIEVLQAQIKVLQERNSAVVLLTQTLRVGSSGSEVRVLQHMLNSEPGIMVAESGAGSPGNETQYFGPKTFHAVHAFQEKYSDEILAPLNLTRSTGVVGPSTREVLNRLHGNAPVDQEGNQDIGTPDAGSQDTLSPYETVDLSSFGTDDGFYIREQSSDTVASGDTLTISGGGFTDDTRVVIGRSILPSEFVTLESEGSLTVEIPQAAPRGINDLLLIKGSLYTAPISTVIVTIEGVERPAIESITQDDEYIMIHGTQFADNNIVHTSWRRIYNLEDENGVISVPKEELRDILGISDEEDMFFYIINENGISDAVEATITDLF